MRQHILNTFAMTLGEAKKLVADIDCAHFATSPHLCAKHPGWVLGHLGGAAVMTANLLGKNLGDMTPWMQAAMAAPEPKRDLYGKKADLLAWLDKSHDAVIAGYKNISDAALAAPFPEEKYRSFWPTLGDGIFYLMAYHEGYHLGQLSSWRRAAGFGPAPE